MGLLLYPRGLRSPVALGKAMLDYLIISSAILSIFMNPIILALTPWSPHSGIDLEIAKSPTKLFIRQLFQPTVFESYQNKDLEGNQTFLAAYDKARTQLEQVGGIEGRPHDFIYCTPGGAIAKEAMAWDPGFNYAVWMRGDRIVLY